MVDALRDRLRGMEPRAAHILVMRLVDGRSRAECATAYGIRLEAFDVKLWRALRELLEPGAAPEAFELEQASADALARALEAPPSEGESAVAAALAKAGELRANAAALRAALDAAARADEDSPGRRREEWLRRAAIVVIIALTAFFYLRARR
jgi:hypothetical protein